MPVVVNTNSTATTASFNLSRANSSLQKSLARLSSGKRIVNPADDSGGLAVAMKLNSKAKRTSAVMQNVQNALSFLQLQDSALETVGKIVDRMAELRTMADDVTKQSSDIENYSKEFNELQNQLRQVKNESFNAISLFAATSDSASGDLVKGSATDNDGNSYSIFSRALFTHPSGQTTLGSVSLNVVNLQYVLSVGTLQSGATSVNLGNLSDGTSSANGLTNGYIGSILEVSMGQLQGSIEKLADARAENGAEQSRTMQVYDLLTSNLATLETAHGRIMDADIALESTRYARYNILVQAGAAMTAQANQLTNVALALLV